MDRKESEPHCAVWALGEKLVSTWAELNFSPCNSSFNLFLFLFKVECLEI
jgi:hypothetical protein